MPTAPQLEDALADLREIVDTVRSGYQVAESRSPVATAALRVLLEVVRQPGIQPGAIAARLRLHRSTASNLLRELQQHALIERRLADGDHRCTEVFASASGRQLLDRTGIGNCSPLESALARLSAREISTLENGMRPLLAALREAHPRGAAAPRTRAAGRRKHE